MSFVGDIGSALIGAKANKKAAKTQADASNYAADLQQQQYEQTREDQMPFLDTGYRATNRLNELLGLGPKFDTSFQNFDAAKYLAANPDAKAWLDTKLGPASIRVFGKNIPTKNNPFNQSAEQLAYEHYTDDAARHGQPRTGDFFIDQTTPSDYGSLMRDFSAADFNTDPGYQFRQQQGQQGMERSASARGGLLSGSAVKDAMRFNQGLASDEYTNAYNRFQTNRANKLNPLQALMGSGQTATNQLTNASQNYANNAGEMALQGANARASGYMANARLYGNALNSIGAYADRNGLFDSFKSTPESPDDEMNYQFK